MEKEQLSNAEQIENVEKTAKAIAAGEIECYVILTLDHNDNGQVQIHGGNDVVMKLIRTAETQALGNIAAKIAKREKLKDPAVTEMRVKRMAAGIFADNPKFFDQDEEQFKRLMEAASALDEYMGEVYAKVFAEGQRLKAEAGK